MDHVNITRLMCGIANSIDVKKNDHITFTQDSPITKKAFTSFSGVNTVFNF